MGEIDAALTMSVDKYGHAEFPRRDAIARAIVEAYSDGIDEAATYLDQHEPATWPSAVYLHGLASACREAAGRIK